MIRQYVTLSAHLHAGCSCQCSVVDQPKTRPTGSDHDCYMYRIWYSRRINRFVEAPKQPRDYLDNKRYQLTRNKAQQSFVICRANVTCMKMIFCSRHAITSAFARCCVASVMGGARIFIYLVHDGARRAEVQGWNFMEVPLQGAGTEPLLGDSSFYARCTTVCALRRIATVSRPSVCLSKTLMYRGHISWVSSKVITRLISLASSLLGAPTPTICPSN